MNKNLLIVCHFLGLTNLSDQDVRTYVSLMTKRNNEQAKVSRAVSKDLFGRILALILLLILSPVFLLTALSIAIATKGPIFYRQVRVGQGGKTFALLKFRSMVIDAEADGVPQWAAKADDRVTSVGRVIRMYRIDELPQLLNVLKGDMSLVGPRPVRPEFASYLRKAFPSYNDLLSVKPGITGWGRVRFHTEEDMQKEIEADLDYVRNHSFWFDAKILLRAMLFLRR